MWSGLLFFVTCSVAKNNKKPAWAILHIKCYERACNINEILYRRAINCYHLLGIGLFKQIDIKLMF